MVLGAFGAHALKMRLSAEALSLWQTAAYYHFWHALALLAVALAGTGPWFKAAGWLFFIGMVIVLYWFATTSPTFIYFYF